MGGVNQGRVVESLLMMRVPRPQVRSDDPRRIETPARIIAFPARPAPPPSRILHISFSPRLGGSERYCINLANQQARLGYAVHVAGLPGSELAAGLAPNVRYHAIDFPLLRAARLSRLIALHGIEVAHAHLSPACKALAAVRAPVRKVATLHVGYKPHQHSRLDGVICVNSTQAAELGGYRGQSRVIANWIPTPRTLGVRPSVRTELGLSPETLIVGAVGRLHASKGCDLLISAFREAAPANAALVFLGEGKQRKALEKLRGDDGRIHFLGFRDDVAPFLRGLDLFVSPSREESFGLAILEAMDAGLPVIATRTDGPKEYMQDQPITLVEPGSVTALACALKLHMQHPAPGPRYDLRDFDPSANIAQVLDFYGQLTGQVESHDTPRIAAAI